MQLKRLLILVLLGFVVPKDSLCQRKNTLDSLMRVYRGAGDDTVKVILLLHIADAYETNNQDSSLHYLEKAKSLTEKLGFTKGLYIYHEQSGILYFTRGDYRSAMDHSNSALRLAKELGNESFVTNMLNNIGIVYQYLGEFEKQLDFTLQAMTRVENSGETRKLSSSYHSVANAYYNLNRYRKSVTYCLRSLSAHEQYGGNTYINRVFATLGQGYEQLNQFDSSLYFYTKAVRKSAELHDTYAEAGIYAYMVNAYASVHDFVSMLDVSQKSLALAKELQSRQLLASSLYNIAFAHYYNNEQEKAKSYIYEALAIAQADSLQDELKNIYAVLSYIAAQEHDFKTSRWARAKSDSMQAALVNTEVVKATTALDAKYESEKREAQIRLQQSALKQKDTMNFILIGGIVFVVIVSILAYRNYIHKQKLQQQRISELETEKQLSATEAVLRGEEQERTRLAKDLHDGLGGMLSGIKYSFNTMKENLIMTPENHQAFERSMDMLDSSIKEMRRVAHNMMPASLMRFGLDTSLRDFCHDINQSGALQVSYQSIDLEHASLPQTTASAVYRIVQELINNSLKHASAKTAIVQITNTGGHITVTVEDDGKGFDTAILKASKGMGWTNIQHRLDFIKATSDVSSQPGKGTSVHIEFDA